MIARRSMTERGRYGRRAIVVTLGVGVLAVGGCTRTAQDVIPRRPWRVAVLELDDGPTDRQAADAVGDGLRASGLVADRDYVLSLLNAHGERAALAGLVGEATRGAADTLVAIGTPALEAALAAKERPPIVFTAVADPSRAGVQPRSIWRRWLPFLFGDDGSRVTGAYAEPGYDDLLAASAGVVGSDGPLGAVVPAGDSDAAAYGEALVVAAERAGRRVELEGSSRPDEVRAAVYRLCDKHIVALVALGDPETGANFGALAEAARQCKVPVIGVSRENAVGGAVLALARDTPGAAHAAGAIVARLARGARPGDIDVQAVPVSGLIVNPEAAEQVDIGIPLALVRRADEVLDE
jgi:putative ABC transport system substrate-binding protein